MKEADDAIAAGMAAIELSRGADYASELRSDLEDAVAHFDRALALVPDHRDALAQKGLCLARLERHAEAATSLEAALRVDPRAPELWLARGRCLAALDRFDEATLAYDETLRLAPGDHEALYRRAEALDALERDDEARAAWDHVLAEPDNRTIDHYDQTFRVVTADVRRAIAQLARAGVIARQGDHAAAVAAYARAFEEGDEVLRAAGGPTRLFAALERVEAARLAFAEHVRKHARSARALKRFGDVYLRSRRPIEALAVFDDMVSIAPDDADAHLGKAEALVQAGRREESIPHYERALAVRPGYLAASARLRVVREELGLVSKTEE